MDPRNSFPSDTITLALALCTIIWLRDRRLGALAVTWTLFFIGLPRIYLGLHWPTDLIAGAIIGVGAVTLAVYVFLSMSRIVSRWWNRWPDYAAAASFMFLFTIGTMFDDVRYLLSILVGKA